MGKVSTVFPLLLQRFCQKIHNSFKGDVTSLKTSNNYDD